MKAEDDELVPLNAMLERSYEPLRKPVPGEREAIVAGLSQSQGTDHPRRRRAWNSPYAWLAAAACLAIAGATIALLVPSSGRLVYGVEAVPGRLAEVKTYRQRGYEIIYSRRDADDPPIRVPIEFLIKRPDKYRFTGIGISHHKDAPPTVRTGLSICDGQHGSGISYDEKECQTGPIGVLEAWIKTEMLAQGHLTTLLGPLGVSYKKVGQETVRGCKCDVYEGRFGHRNESEDAFVSKLWIDPTTGFPLRSTKDEILPDGSSRRVQELEDIAVNVPLDDKLFELTPPEGFKVVTSNEVVDPTKLSSRYTSAGFGGNQQKFEFWHSFRITDHAALVVWRRSAPEVADDGTSDWLSGVTFGINGDKPDRPVRHDWVYQSRSPDVWNWSLLVVDDGPLPDRGGIRFDMKGDRFHSRNVMLPLRFPELGLTRIIEAAAVATLPEDGPHFKLEHLRVLAGQLAASEKAPPPSDP